VKPKAPLKHTPRPKPLALDDATIAVDEHGDGLTITLRPKNGGRVLPMLKRPDAP
jgi:hypothetical protein